MLFRGIAGEGDRVSHAKSSLGKNATEAQGEAVVAELMKAGKLKIGEKGAVEHRV